MAEEVDIGNVGGEAGVASEVTLRRLLVAMDKLAKERNKVDGSKAKDTKEGLNKKISAHEGIAGDSAVARLVIKGRHDIIKADNTVSEYIGIKRKKEDKDD